MNYVQAQYVVDEDTWPPSEQHCFTPIQLGHHEGREKVMESATHAIKITKEITDILTPLEQSDTPQFILVEGAPGIGKSVLLREIAYRWANQQSLQTFMLVLLVCLRDPIAQATSISDLLLSYCKGDSKAKEIARTCSDSLLKNAGRHLVFLFDGFDEFPENLRKDSLIGAIINRKILPLCELVVSSRPHASVTFKNQATIKVNILGFTEEERYHYIEQSLQKKEQSIKELTLYLKNHPAISNLCLTPYNMQILLFLFKMGFPLPSDSVTLYHHFICLTICRNLAKFGHSFDASINHLDDLPEPYGKFIRQISKLALQGLNSNQLVFTYEEVSVVCPDIITYPGGINGFGMIQAVQHHALTGKTYSFNFVHFTIQEFLAAYYIITDLPPDEELCLLRKFFWSEIHANMFSIYVTLTKGQRLAFKKFLSNEDDQVTISNSFLCNHLQSIRLFSVFYSAQDFSMCKCIEEAAVFSNKQIDLGGTKLFATNLENLSLFLTSSSHKIWLGLNLYNCLIQDHGLHVMHKQLNQNNIVITRLWLDNNGLTKLSSPYLRDIVLSCKVEELLICNNETIGEGLELYTTLTHPSSMLACLNIDSTSLSSVAARVLFTAVKDSDKLKELHIRNNNITDDITESIITLLATNRSLKRLEMHGNPISGEAIALIVQSLRGNSTLHQLGVPRYRPAIKNKIKSAEQEINRKRKSQGIQEKLTIWC